LGQTEGNGLYVNKEKKSESREEAAKINGRKGSSSTKEKGKKEIEEPQLGAGPGKKIQKMVGE